MKNAKLFFAYLLIVTNVLLVLGYFFVFKNAIAIWCVCHIPFVTSFLESPSVITAVFVLLLLLIELILLFFLRKSKYALFIAFSFCVGAVSVLGALNRNDEIAAEFDFAFLDEDWDWIVEHSAHSGDNSDLRCNYINLALAKKGVLCDRLFHRRGVGMSKLIGGDSGKMQSLVRCYIYKEIGADAEAEAEISNLNFILRNIPLVKTMDEQIKKGEKTLSFENVNTMIMYYLKKNPENRMAAQYLLASDLVLKNLEYLYDDLKIANFKRIPVHCQEAVVFKWYMENKTLEGVPFNVSKDVCDNYDRLMDDRRYHRFNRTHLSFAFGKTFWYYLYVK